MHIYLLKAQVPWKFDILYYQKRRVTCENYKARTSTKSMCVSHCPRKVVKEMIEQDLVEVGLKIFMTKVF